MKAPMKATVLLISAILVLGTFGLASGADVWVDMNEVTGLVDGYIPEGGGDLTIPVRLTNSGGDRSCISNGFLFSGDGITFSSMTASWNEGYPWNIDMGFPLMQYPYFDAGLYINFFDVNLDLVVPDSLPGDRQPILTAYGATGAGFAGLSNSRPGLPAGFDDIAYYITLTGVSGDPGDVLTMDSSFWNPANVWLWCDEPTYYPTWDGPYEFGFFAEPEEAPLITSTPATAGIIGALYEYTIVATGSPVPTLSFTDHDGFGLALEGNVLSGTPTAAGEYNVTVVASNGIEPDAVQNWTITVTPPPEAPTITSTPSTAGQVGVEYSYTVEYTGYPEVTLTLTDHDGFGLGLEGDVVSGIPTAAGDYEVTVVAANGVMPNYTQNWTITVVPGESAPEIYSTPILTGLAGQPYSYNVDASGYPAPTYYLDVNPDGMVIDEISGVITWPSPVAGTHAVTVRASNGVEPDDTQSYELVIPDAPYTNCWPQPWDMGDMINDRVLEVYIYNENPSLVDLGSVRVGNIPPYNPIEVLPGDVINTDCFIMRFLGSSGFRPLPPEGIDDTYTVYYNYTDGSAATPLVGDFKLSVKVGDVDLNGVVDISDVEFMARYFFNGGEETNVAGDSLYELMDVNLDGEVNIQDAQAIIDLAGI